MGNYAKRLDDRIRRLSNDIQSTNDWRKVRIEIEKRGGRWAADNGMVFELRDGVIYQFLSDHRQGVSQLTITALDTEVPFVADLSLDLQGTPPDRRAALIRELMDAAARVPPPRAELVHVVPGDWLTKISLARWGTKNWRSHLRPTKMTLDARTNKGKTFNSDLIYPGDTFEVIR